MAGNYIGYHYQFRVILIGDSTVGKTSLVYELQEGAGNLEHSLTLGVDYYSKVFQKDEKVIKVQIWDTAGQDRFRSIVRTYYRNAIGGLLVFDLTNRSSFESVPSWLEEARYSQDSDDGYVYVLVGNKADMKEKRVVSNEEAETFASKNNMRYIETSATTNSNVYKAFDLLVDEILYQIDEGRIRMDRRSWDGVREGHIITDSRILTNTIPTTDDGTEQVASINTEQATRTKCQC